MKNSHWHTKVGDAEILTAASAPPYFYQFVGSRAEILAVQAVLSMLFQDKYARTDIRVVPGVSYRRHLNHLSIGLQEMVVAHPAFFTTWQSDDFLLISPTDERPPQFFARLRQHLKLPVDKTWGENEQDKLWKMGLAGQMVSVKDRGGEEFTRRLAPIRRVPGGGQHVWEVSTSADYLPVWLDILRVLYETGTQGGGL